MKIEKYKNIANIDFAIKELSYNANGSVAVRCDIFKNDDWLDDEGYEFKTINDFAKWCKTVGTPNSMVSEEEIKKWCINEFERRFGNNVPIDHFEDEHSCDWMAINFWRSMDNIAKEKWKCSKEEDLQAPNFEEMEF